MPANSLHQHDLHNSGTNGGNSVEVEGSFDNWTTRHSLQRSGKDFTLVKLLAPGVYQVSCQPRRHVSECSFSSDLNDLCLRPSAKKLRDMSMTTVTPLLCADVWWCQTTAYLCTAQHICCSLASPHISTGQRCNCCYATSQHSDRSCSF